MAVNGYDVQVFLSKTLKLLSTTCITLLVTYPFASFSLLSLFLLYIIFPWFFWYLVYSFPLFVCACLIILRIASGPENGEKRNDDEKDEKFSTKSKPACDNNVRDNTEKSFKRAHSVRQRRAKNIAIKDEVVEKNAVSSTIFAYDDAIIDKNAVIEEKPKEIREVEVLYSSLVHNKVKDEKEKHEEIDIHDGNKALQLEKDEKNVMEDIAISEVERHKRLESLIARRRSRKLLNLQVRRTLMKMDRNDRISNLVIPKLHANNIVFNISGGQISPVPGSAPSILMPMRNPFDIPYDPHEEKPDLTGDGFNQEFNISPSLQTNKDLMFCRHESFHFGPFSPDSEDQDSEKKCDFGFDQNPSFRGYHQFDGENSQKIEPEEGSIIDNPQDQIKEIIQISENEIHNHAQEHIDQGSSPKSSSSSSSEQFLKIDKEAILKSLSSLARRNVPENNDDQINDYLSYPTALFTNSRLDDEQFYYSDKATRRHGHTYSIASDMHVELSEISSPPLTIDENMSFQGDDISTYDREMESNTIDENERYHQMEYPVEGNIRACEDFEARLENIHEHDKTVTLSIPVDSDSLTTNVSNPQNGLDSDSLLPVEASTAQTSLDSRNLLAEVNIPPTEDSPADVSIHHGTLGSDSDRIAAEISIQTTTPDVNISQGLPVMPNEDVEQVNDVQNSTISPKSVLISTFSVSSFDQYIGREDSVHDLGSLAIQNSAVPVEHLMTLQSSDDELQILQESSSQLPRMLEAENIEPAIELKISGSHEEHPEPLNPTAGPSSTSFSNASNSSLSSEKEPDNSSQRLLGESTDNSISNGHDPDVKAKGVINESSSSGSH